MECKDCFHYSVSKDGLELCSQDYNIELISTKRICDDFVKR